MPVTELEQASINAQKIKEYDGRIEQIREFQLSCKKANDNIGDMAWAHEIKKLKAERSALDQANKYVRFSVFTQCVKAYLTPQQYNDCWDRVDEVLDHPELMQL